MRLRARWLRFWHCLLRDHRPMTFVRISIEWTTSGGKVKKRETVIACWECMKEWT
jgi:hypothetical protein